jgi:hypothetical protein
VRREKPQSPADGRVLAAEGWPGFFFSRFMMGLYGIKLFKFKGLRQIFYHTLWLNLMALAPITPN